MAQQVEKRSHGGISPWSRWLMPFSGYPGSVNDFGQGSVPPFRNLKETILRFVWTQIGQTMFLRNLRVPLSCKCV